MNKTIQEWFADPRFKELSSADKERAIGNYFDREVASQPGPAGEPFDTLPENQRRQTRENFIRQNLDPNLPPPPSRGWVGDVGTAVVRGALGVPELGLKAFSGAVEGAARLTGTQPGGLGSQAREWAKDVAAYRDETFPPSRESIESPVRGAVTQGVESTVTSLGVGAPLAVAGAQAAAGAGIARALGAAYGYIAGAPLFGAAAYDDSLEKLRKSGVPEDEAQMAFRTRSARRRSAGAD
jgi:hypothetical protein